MASPSAEFVITLLGALLVRVGEAIFLACLLLPFVRLLATDGFRRRLNALRGMRALIVLAIIGYAGGVIGLAVFFPPALFLAFLIGSTLGVGYVWYARPAYGRARGLPPGSLRILSPEPWTDQEFYAKNFQRYGPIFKMSDVYRPAVCIMGIPRVRSFLAEYQDALRVPPFPFGRFIPGGFMRFTDPERHRSHRPYFQHAFTLDVYRPRQDWVAETMRAHFQNWTALSTTSVGGIYLKPHIRAMMHHILACLFFGFVPGTEEFRAAQADFDDVIPQHAHRVPDERVKRALSRLKQAIQDRAAVEMSFASEMERAHPGALQDDFLAYNLIYFQILACNDLTGLLYWMVQMLVSNPGWLSRLQSGSDNPDLPTRIVLETLRLEQSEFLIRQTTRDIQFENCLVPKGWFVRLCIRESHRLSETVQEPTRFNPDRFLTWRPTRLEYMPFGAFDKSCLGEALTLKLGHLFAAELARSCNLHVSQTGPPEFSGNHWQPGSNCRLVLTRRVPAPSQNSAIQPA